MVMAIKRNNDDSDNNNILLGITAATIIITFFLITSSAASTITIIKNNIQFLLSPPQVAYAQTVSQNNNCNCIIDYTSSGHGNNNITGITIPKVRLLKNETLQSQTEGRLNWIAVKPIQLIGILTKDFFLGNFSGGTSATVALNTINVRPNESLAVQITGGNIPSVAKGEIVKADVNENGTLGEIKTSGKKIIEFPLEYNKSLPKSVSGKNSFMVSVSEPGYYLLLISLTYNNNNNSMAINKDIKSEQTKNSLIPIYETLLKLEGI
jgi:hypothetical protein